MTVGDDHKERIREAIADRIASTKKALRDFVEANARDDALFAARRRGPQTPGEAYRPSTGTEGATFEDSWCKYCEYATDCVIFSDAMLYDVDDAKYPPELVVAEDGWGSCQAYRLRGTQRKRKRQKKVTKAQGHLPW